MQNGHLLHQSGFTGTGINIALIDAGYEGVNQGNAFDSLRNSGRLLGSYNFIAGDSNVFIGWGSHGTGVLSTMAAHIPDTIVGTAPDANYWLFTTENIFHEKPIEMDHWLMAAEFADSVGVHLISTSLSYRTFDNPQNNYSYSCLLYTSDAADDMQCVDLGGRRIIKKNFFFLTKNRTPKKLLIFSSRRRHTRCREVSWARRCV